MARRSAHRDADGAGEAAPALSRRAWRPVAGAALLMLAAANVGFGLLFRRAADGAADFELVMIWVSMWVRGENPYAPPHSLADYPPNAMVMLAPLALFALPQAIAVWSWLHVALSAAIAVLSAGLTRSRAAALLFGAAVLALPPFRIPLQFSVLPFAAALAGFAAADRYPRLAGVSIGLSLLKPQIGGPALVWAIAARRWQTAGYALATPIALFVVYLARALRSPVTVVSEWLQALVRTQNRGDLPPGETSLQALVTFTGLMPVTLQAIVALLLGAGLLMIWRRRDRDFDLRFLAAASLLSLLAFRHLSYNLLLAIPALAFCLSHTTRAVRALGMLATAVMIASPPSVWRHLIEPRGVASMFDPLAAHAYRIAGLALFLVVVLSRRPGQGGRI